jgi:hypothetical protein
MPEDNSAGHAFSKKHILHLKLLGAVDFIAAIL